jgi:hypothetical protein
MGHGKSWEEYLDVLERFLCKCQERYLKLDVVKSVLGDRKAHWCGRDVDGDGVSYRARKTNDLLSMEMPTLAGELCQFLHSMSWMQGSLPRFAEVAAPLNEIKKAAEAKGEAVTGNRRKRSYELIPLKLLDWTEKHEKAFLECQNMLNNLMKNGHVSTLDESQTLCLLTDASQRHYAALLTSVKNWDPAKKVEEQDHRLLRTFSGEFKGAQVKWSTIEKDSFPSIEAVTVWREDLM